MTAATVPGTAALSAEWERVEALASCLLAQRDGQPVTEALLDRVTGLQAAVERGRAADPRRWLALAGEPLTALECDVVACAVGPEAEPRLGWLFGQLQPVVPQPYPTPALLHELLALDADGAHALHAVLAEHAPLRRAHVLQLDGDDPFQPLRPGRGVTARLLGRPVAVGAPPATMLVQTDARWADLVLPDDRIAMLREFLLWIRHRDTVLTRWGGQDCGGPVALFAGPSGTGKTLAAAVVAADLGWPLYRVDLGHLVSKYIGETEKNLNRLFDAAHGNPMVLQFDEADSLFSKRGEVKEARDRYANLEVSHLLARIESHRGPCILTTNLRRNLDSAFARRFQVVVGFPRPDAAARARLWARLLPPRAPRAPDVDLDLVAGTVTLSGGGIRNSALHAAFVAAGEGEPIRMRHLALAVWRELGKDGRDLSPADLGVLAAHLPEGSLS